jgi:uncharacterized coiled-coil protein SlyX
MADDLPELSRYQEYLATRIRTFESKTALDDWILNYVEPSATDPDFTVANLTTDLRGLADKLIAELDGDT